MAETHRRVEARSIVGTGMSTDPDRIRDIENRAARFERDHAVPRRGFGEVMSGKPHEAMGELEWVDEPPQERERKKRGGASGGDAEAPAAGGGSAGAATTEGARASTRAPGPRTAGPQTAGPGAIRPGVKGPPRNVEPPRDRGARGGAPVPGQAGAAAVPGEATPTGAPGAGDGPRDSARETARPVAGAANPDVARSMGGRPRVTFKV